MIRLDQVSKKYRTERIETTALDNINLDVEKGEFVSVMGPSGCGKSTLLNLIGLLDEPSEGKVSIGGNAIDRYGDRALARMRNERIGFIFQQFHLVSRSGGGGQRGDPAALSQDVQQGAAEDGPRRSRPGGARIAHAALPDAALGRPAAARCHRPRDRWQARRSFWRTSRPETSTARWVTRSWASSRI